MRGSVLGVLGLMMGRGDALGAEDYSSLATASDKAACAAMQSQGVKASREAESFFKTIDQEPSREGAEEGEEIRETSKRQMEKWDLDSFLNTVPKTPSETMLKEVRQFVEEQGCDKCQAQNKTVLPQKVLPKTGGVLEVYVSFSLGESVLKTLCRDVSKVGGRLMMRGLPENSFEVLREQVDRLGISIEIDPPAFEENSVHQVPTFILKERAGERSDRVSGVQSVRSVLELMAERGDLKAEAAELLKRLGEGR